MKRLSILLLFLTCLQGQAQISLDTDSSSLPVVPTYNRGSYFALAPLIGNSTATLMPQMVRFIDGFNLIGSNYAFVYKMGFVLNKFRIGASTVSSFGPSIFNQSANSRQDIETKYSFFYAGADVGYVFAQSRNRLWSVYGAFGGVYSELLLLKSSNATFNFNQALTAPLVGQSPLLEHNSACFEIGIESMQRPKKPTSFNLAWSLGIRRGLRAKTWESRHLTLQNAPTDRITQVYINTYFLVGANRVRKPKQP